MFFSLPCLSQPQFGSVNAKGRSFYCASLCTRLKRDSYSVNDTEMEKAHRSPFFVDYKVTVPFSSGDLLFSNIHGVPVVFTVFCQSRVGFVCSPQILFRRRQHHSRF